MLCKFVGNIQTERLEAIYKFLQYTNYALTFGRTHIMGMK